MKYNSRNLVIIREPGAVSGLRKIECTTEQALELAQEILKQLGYPPTHSWEGTAEDHRHATRVEK